MKEKLFKFLNICKNIFLYIYAIFLFMCFCGIFIAEILGLLAGGYYVILNNLYYFYIFEFILFVICIIYFNYYLYYVGKHMYNILNNENIVFKDYFISFSFIVFLLSFFIFIANIYLFCLEIV